MFPSSDNAFSLSTLLSVYASITGFMMLFRKMLNDFMPMQLRSYLFRLLDQLFTPKSNNLTVIIDEKFGSESNHVFEAAEIYLRKKISPDTKQLCVGKTTKEKHFTISIVKGEEIFDSFENSKMKWNYVESEENKFNEVKRHYRLTFENKLREKVMGSYLSHVLAEAEEIKKNLRVVKLYSKDARPGEATMVLLVEVGGTGKSSLIAAMANYLKFDIFDLELSSVQNNGEFKRILLSTTNRSILVIEDIDCNAEVRDREAENQERNMSRGTVTLSGILNFIDGLWSSAGDERIIVFTTNHKEQLDPALLSPGRMDMHIHMSYCTSLGFRTLVSNYLGLDDLNHPLCEEIEKLVDSTTTRKHAEFRRRFRRTSMSSDICDGLLTNFRPNPKKWSRRNSVSHFRRNSDETRVVGIFRRLFDDIPIKNVTVVVVGSSSVYSDEFPTTFRLKPFEIGQYRRNSDGLLYIRRNFVGKSSEGQVYYRSWMDKPHLDPNTNSLTEEYVQGIGEFMRLVQQQPDAKSVTPAELAEELMQDDDIDVVLRGVISFIEKKKVERNNITT
ncbi:hypothetical protein F2Q69_00040535 [Brassica cretica]|uniref:AAA+ ATPase domain-containing protein n=1 Tax=Brassica cretica TaxID=69181 RepID=A0A8S9NQD3_BRACR|nr:hypothetical protein F2Q69_00040535 [Brassica cretica]